MKTLMPLGLVLLVAPLFAAPVFAATTPGAASLGPVQSLQGQVWRVDLAHKELTIKDKSGALFDFVVEPSTHIKSDYDGKTLTFGDLFGANQVTIKFAAEKKGDVAESIEVVTTS